MNTRKGRYFFGKILRKTNLRFQFSNSKIDLVVESQTRAKQNVIHLGFMKDE